MEEKKMNPLRRRAQVLRKNATKEENHLWYDFLRQYPVQFRRQAAFAPYVVDFYCRKAKLVVELDGSQHYESDQMQRDSRRTEYLAGLGIEVIRFSNLEVNRYFPEVCSAIHAKVHARMRLPEGEAVERSETDGGMIPKGDV